MRVLVVEDDAALRDGVKAGLEAAGFAVDVADDLPEAEMALDLNRYDCVVLDRMLPSGDSLALLAQRRERGDAVPALFLTARDAVADRVEGFHAGGDDYLVKPFALDELVVRVGSLCRRARDARPPLVTVGDLVVDTARCEVRRDGVLLPLARKEYRLLEVLATQADTVVSRTELIERCWDELVNPMSNVIDVHIKELRRKLGSPPLIHTVRGIGYLLGTAPDGAS